MIDYGSVKQRIAEFDRRNGGNSVMVGEWFYYPNGAMREYEPLGRLADPPADEYERHLNIVRYHEARRIQAVREFDAFKERLIFSGPVYNEGEALDRLKQLQAAVEARNKDVEEAKAALAATKRGRMIAEHREAEAAERQREREFKDKLQTIRI